MAAVNKLVCFLLVFLLFAEVYADAGAGDVPGQSDGVPQPRIECGFACARRCSKSSRRNMCMRACGGCCRKCQCVPPGTAGNKELCPCYASMRTRGGLKPKCP